MKKLRKQLKIITAKSPAVLGAAAAVKAGKIFLGLLDIPRRR